MSVPSPRHKIWREPYLRDLAVELVRVDHLQPMPRQARRHRRKQVRQIATSIETFGFTNPILIDDDNRVVAGFGRVLAAQMLDMSRIPATRLSDMTEAQLRAYAIADNRIAELAGWDEEVLALEFEYIHELDICLDLSVTGFETPEVDLIMGEAALEEPEPPIPPLSSLAPVSQRGDLWRLGPHRLYCGDARQLASYNVLMAGDTAGMVFTDPPYNLQVASLVGKGRLQYREFAMASGEMSEGAFRQFLEDVFTHITAHCRDGSIHFFCMDWRHIELLLSVSSTLYTELKNLCVWDKGRGGMGSLYRSQHELIAVLKAGRAPHVNNIELGKYGRNRTNVWRYPPARPGGEADLDLHPTSKPVSMISDAILDCSHRGNIILDPFGGSGATLLAAERTGRRGYLVELDPRYVDVIIRRWQGVTGAPAVHDATGQTFDRFANTRSCTPPLKEIPDGR